MKILSAKLPYPIQIRGKPRTELVQDREGVSLSLVEVAGSAFLRVAYAADEALVVRLIPGHQYAHLVVEDS